MVFNLRIKSIAYEDINDAVSWYEKEMKELGKRFLLQLEEAGKEYTNLLYRFRLSSLLSGDAD